MANVSQVGRGVPYVFGRRDRPNADDFNLRWNDIDRRLNQTEAFIPSWDAVVNGITEDAITRIDNVITPIAVGLQQTAELGFLTAYSLTPGSLVSGNVLQLTLTAGPQADNFYPSPFLILERLANTTDYAICRLVNYKQDTRLLSIELLSVYGNPGPFSDWSITDSPGVSEAIRALLNQTIAAQTDTITRQADVTSRQSDIQARQADVVARQTDVGNKQGVASAAATTAGAYASQAAASAASVDPTSFVKRNNSQPATSVLTGVAPAANDSSAAYVTSQWVRDRIAELVNGSSTALDTLKELADALGGDANFSTTVTTALGNRLRIDAAVAYTTAQLAILMGAIAQLSAVDQIGSVTGTYTPDFSNGLLTKAITLGGNITVGFPTNLPNGSTFTLIITQGTGGQTIAWNAAWKFGAGGTPVLSTGAGVVDILCGIIRSNGTIACGIYAKGPF